MISPVVKDRKAPEWFASAFKAKRSPAHLDWMRRHQTTEQGLCSRAYSVFVSIAAAGIVVLMLSAIVFGLPVLTYLLVPFLLTLVIVPSLVVGSPATSSRREELEMLRESPTVIGAMSMSMQLQPSLDRAVAFASQCGDGSLNVRLKTLLWQVLTRVRYDLPTSMMEFASTLGEENESLRQSIHLFISATHESTREGMDRLLDKANMLVIEGVKDRVERYVSSLALPTMVFFAFGILLPVMMFSLVPLLTLGSVSSIGSTTNTAPIISDAELALLLLVVFPMASFLYSRSTLSRNPLQSVSRPELVLSRKALVTVTVYVASMIVLSVLMACSFPEIVLIIGVCVPSTYFYVRLKAAHARAAKLPGVEKDFVNALYQMGNRMTTGMSFDVAFEEVARSRSSSPFGEFAKRSIYKCLTTRQDLPTIIASDAELLALSPLVRNALVTVAECAASDPQAAGKVALNLAQYLSDLRTCQAKIHEKLQSVVDMMSSTSAIFAPIVLGITGSLFSLVGAVSPSSGSVQNMTMLGGIYVVELTFIVSYFTVFLLGGKSWTDVTYRFFTKVPVAVIVFILVSLAARGGLTQLL
ncbi:MAG: hypothetical protein ABR986_01475 [Methanomassiliicoccales archaeon]|jgi:hypothetical protein